MSKNKNLEDFAKVISECVKCGVCQAHCPTYQLKRKEGTVARGKIALAAALLHGEADVEKRLQEDISMCLMCGSCASKCPNKVPTHEIVGAMRRRITDNQGLSLVGKGVSTLLGSKVLMNSLSKGGALLSPLLEGLDPQRLAVGILDSTDLPASANDFKKSFPPCSARRAVVGVRTVKSGQGRWFVGYKKHSLRLWLSRCSEQVLLVRY